MIIGEYDINVTPDKRKLFFVNEKEIYETFTVKKFFFFLLFLFLINFFFFFFTFQKSSIGTFFNQFAGELEYQKKSLVSKNVLSQEKTEKIEEKKEEKKSILSSFLLIENEDENNEKNKYEKKNGEKKNEEIEEFEEHKNKIFLQNFSNKKNENEIENEKMKNPKKNNFLIFDEKKNEEKEIKKKKNKNKKYDFLDEKKIVQNFVPSFKSKIGLMMDENDENKNGNNVPLLSQYVEQKKRENKKIVDDLNKKRKRNNLNVDDDKTNEKKTEKKLKIDEKKKNVKNDGKNFSFLLFTENDENDETEQNISKSSPICSPKHTSEARNREIIQTEENNLNFGEKNIENMNESKYIYSHLLPFSHSPQDKNQSRKIEEKYEKKICCEEKKKAEKKNVDDEYSHENSETEFCEQETPIKKKNIPKTSSQTFDKEMKINFDQNFFETQYFQHLKKKKQFSHRFVDSDSPIYKQTLSDDLFQENVDNSQKKSKKAEKELDKLFKKSFFCEMEVLGQFNKGKTIFFFFYTFFFTFFFFFF